MKREIIEVTIIANVRPRLRSRCIEVQRKHDPIPQSYPLTERNYWRAVGMQLRLAGFAESSHSYPETGTLVVSDSSDIAIGTELTIGGETMRVVHVDGRTLSCEYVS